MDWNALWELRQKILDREKEGKGKSLSPADLKVIAKAIENPEDVESIIRGLVRNCSYGNMLDLADKWSELLQVERKLFELAWRGRALEVKGKARRHRPE